MSSRHPAGLNALAQHIRQLLWAKPQTLAKPQIPWTSGSAAGSIGCGAPWSAPWAVVMESPRSGHRFVTQRWKTAPARP